MPPDLEPAGALAERIEAECCVEPSCGFATCGGFRNDLAAPLIEADRAAVREPLERQLSESRKSAEHSHKLYTDLDAEVESALSKFAPFADEDQELTLTELADEAWNSWASTADELKNAEERIASLEAQLAAAREEALREAFGIVVEAFQGESHERHPALFRAYCAIVGKLIPAAQKEPSRAEPARRCVYDGTPLEPGDTVCGACCCVQPAQKEPL